MLVKVITLVFLVHCAFSNDSLLTPCPIEDIQCLSETTENFLNRTASGIPNYGIKAIDPIIIDMVCSKLITGVMSHFKNVNVTGLRNQKISDFKMDKGTQSVELSVNAYVNINSDLEVEYEETKNIFSGTFSSRGKAVLISRYNYELKADKEGVEHFEAGPETITCELSDFVTVFRPELLSTMLTEINLTGTDVIFRRQTCDILKTAYATVLENLRVVAKLYPKSAFFSNI